MLLSEYGFHLPSNPYAEVNLDEVVQDYLLRKGVKSSGEKRQLLEESNYWQDYTIHSFPQPAHPSHRLVVALRLIALDDDGSPTTAAAATVADYSPLVKKQKLQNYSLDVKEWQAMVMGHTETISSVNEKRVCQLLTELCQEVQMINLKKRAAIDKASSLFTSTAAAEESHLELNQNIRMITSLLEEESSIAQMVKEAVVNGLTDW
jgi:hypothetical protein